MSAHTPGPWHVYKPQSRSLPHIMSADGLYVMDAPQRGGTAHAIVRQMADARLIAAAPELLAACNRALSMLGSLHPDGTDPYVIEGEASIRAAIAKASSEGSKT